MLFLVLLALAAFALAGAAEFFSVWGLAHTFAGVFWSVVIMGSALGAGKLMGVSYLYRYWKETPKTLKAYLFAGIAVMMMLTSGGIFGYLSSGYQQDVLPLKQKQGQVQLLTEERDRALARKKQIDDLLAGGPNVTDVNNAQATRALRETTRARESQSRQYRDEHTQLMKRLSELDEQTLKLKGELLQSEAHVGPIIYIAQAFNLPTDDATKYLVFLIIFAFDPMAIALTLCFNIAVKLRQDEQEAAKKALEDQAVLPVEVTETISEPEIVHEAEDEPPADLFPQEYISDSEEDKWYKDRNTFDFDAHQHFMQPLPASEPEPAADFSAVNEFWTPLVEEPDTENPPPFGPEPVQEETLEEAVDAVEQAIATPVEQVDIIGRSPRTRPFGNRWMTEAPPAEKLAELMNHYRLLQAKSAAGQTLTKDELWEFQGIERILKQHGYDKYLN